MSDREKPKDDPPAGAPLWVVTFTDMSSLLLTFFILILTFSSTEKEMMSKAQGSLQGSFGLVTDRRTSKPDPTPSLDKNQDAETHPDGTPEKAMRLDQVQQDFDLVQNREIFNVKIDEVTEGLRIRIDPPSGEEHFALLTGRMHPKTRQLLAEFGTLFRSRLCRFVIETHVDSRTWKLRRGENSIDWTLRHGLDAAAVLERIGIPGERIAVSPRGDFEPLADDADGEQARYLNRRLEILVIPFKGDPVYAAAGKGQ